MTPLIVACMRDHAGLVCALLEGKADLTIGDKVRIELLESW